MRPIPANQLHPRVKIVWRITHVMLWVLLCGLMVVTSLISVGLVGYVNPALKIVFLCECIVACVFGIVYVLVWPQISYLRWRYELGEHELDIARGIIWRKRFIIPFVRVQNTDTNQGPLMRLFGLASVTVSTAAGEHVIPGLSIQEADCLRDLIATQARLAQEDV